MNEQTIKQAHRETFRKAARLERENASLRISITELEEQLAGVQLQYTLVDAEHAGDHEALEVQDGVLKKLQERFRELEGWAQRYLDLSDISEEHYRDKYDVSGSYPIKLDEDDIAEGIRQVLHPEVT